MILMCLRSVSALGVERVGNVRTLFEVSDIISCMPARAGRNLWGSKQRAPALAT